MLSSTHVWIPAIILASLLVRIEAAYAQQPTDIAVEQILVPGDQVPPGEAITPTFRLANQGNNPATNFFCGVRIFAPSAPSNILFQNQINVPSLAAGATVVLETTQSWTPPAPGEYVVQVGAIYEFDTAPTNNGRDKNFTVAEPGLLTLAQAVDILNAEILDGHPRADSLVALHISSPNNPADSLLPPGTIIQSADSSLTLQYDYPVYFFYVDLYPDQLYSHPVEYVAISAVNGEIDRHADQELWPEIDGVTPEFGPYCFGEENPRRVRGAARQCVEKQNPYQPVATANTNSWAIAVVGKLNLDVEKSTVQNDICKWKERINGNPLGPQVSGPNISANSGRENCGLTEKELCDAIDALKGKGCDKVYFKYVGHGTESGIVLWDERHRNSTTLSWTKLAKKLKEAGFAEVCLEITACHSGAAIAALKREGIKGTVVTSSSAANTTPVGDGSGTHWEKALEACSKDQNADLNRNGKIDACELFAWVKARGNADANNPNPQLEKLNDTVRFVSAKSERVGSGQTISTNTGSIKVYAERICMKLKVQVGNRQKDSTVYRGSVYIENDGNNDRAADRDYKITARCGKQEVVIVERIRPRLKRGEKQCIAELPGDCTGIKVERLRNGTIKEEEDPVILSSAADGYFSTTGETAVHNPGEFIFHRYVYQWDNPADPHTASITAPNGWDAGIGPGEFFTPNDSTEDLFISVLIPDTATVGGVISSSIVNAAINDTLQVRYNILLSDTLRQVNIDQRLEASGRWYGTDGSATLKGFRVDLENVYIRATDSLRIEAVGEWNWKDVIVDADSGVVLVTEAGFGAGSTRWENVVMRGTGDQGFVSLAGNVVMRNVTVGGGTGHGFSFSGSTGNIDTVAPLRLDTLEFLNVIGARDYGAVFYNINSNSPVVDTATVRWLRVEFVDMTDVAVMRNSHVRCVDCMYRDGEVYVDTTSSLSRYATLSLAAVDTAGNGLENISITVVDSLGRTIYSGRTDADGFVPEIEGIISRHEGNSYQSYLPFVIAADNGILEITDTIRSAVYTQRIYEFNEGAASVPVAGERSDNAGIVKVIPQPASADDELVVETVGLETQRLNVTLYNELGQTVWIGNNLPVSNNRLVLPGFGRNQPPGLYVLRLHLDDESFLSTKVLIR